MKYEPEFHRKRARRYRRRGQWGALGVRDVALMMAGGIALGLVIAAPERAGQALGTVATTADRAATAARALVTLRGAGTAMPARHFGRCFTGGGTNCVVDGDTFWIDGEKVRVADIDAPETHPPRCAEERRLGHAATVRLQALLNAGPFTLVTADRDTDRYGRKLRIVERDGQSLGAVLVDEGLAREWGGRRAPWC